MSFLLQYIPSRRDTRSSDTMLRNGKRVTHVAALLGQEGHKPTPPSTPVKKQRVEFRREIHLLELPEDIIERYVIGGLDYVDLCALLSTSKALGGLVTDDAWKLLTEARWGASSDLLVESALVSGSWRALYKDKHVSSREAGPWRKLSHVEQSAAVNRIISERQSAGASSLAVVFLVDGSGSVTEDDFQCMTSFIMQAVSQLVAADPSVQVGVLQFSNDVRVEVQPGAVDEAKFAQAVGTMARMNGGTNIACCVQRAGQMLKSHPHDQARVLVLLTDGRVDDYQAREAAEMAARMADEQGPLAVYAFGVGRGVDSVELQRIVGATQHAQHVQQGAAGGDSPQSSGCSGASSRSRYFDLCVLDEAPW